MTPAVPQERHVPLVRKFARHAAPQPLNVPLDVDVVLHNQRALVTVANDLFEGACLTPIGRNDAFVNLSYSVLLEWVVQRRGKIESVVRGAERRVLASIVGRFEIGSP